MTDLLNQPTPEKIKAARIAERLTQPQAAALVHVSKKTWQNWESTTNEHRKMPICAWELFLIKTKIPRTVSFFTSLDTQKITLV